MMRNCFCGMIDQRKAFSLISSWGHCQRSSPSRISNMIIIMIITIITTTRFIIVYLLKKIRIVEALGKRLLVKIKLCNGETVYLTKWKFSTCGCDLFNYRLIKLVKYTVFLFLNKLCTQCVCDKIKKSNYHFNY